MKTNPAQKILLVLISIMVSFILFFGVIKSNAVKNYGLNFIHITKFYLLQNPLETVKKMMYHFQTMNQLTLKNIQFEEDVKHIERIRQENITLKNQIDELNQLLQLQNKNPQFHYTHAAIITRNLNTWKDEFIVNVGKKENVQVGNIVVGPQGIIGKISEVFENTSVVSLITSTTSSQQFSVIIDSNDKTVHGIVQSYKAKTNTLSVRLLNSDTMNLENAIVKTSGIGKLYPEGIVLGTVKQNHTDQKEFGSFVQVTPAQNIDQVRFVSVIVGSK